MSDADLEPTEDRARRLRVELDEALARIDELLASRAQLLTILAHAPDFVLELDRDGTITFMNRPAPGYQLSDMVGSDVRRWMEPEHHADLERALCRVFESGEPSSYESVGAVTKRYYRHRLSPVLGVGAIRRAVLITHDISGLKAKERELQELQSRFRALVSASFEGIVVSIDQRIVDVNQAAADLLQASPEELLGRHASELLPPEAARRVGSAIARGSEAAYEIELHRPDGTTLLVEVLGRNALYQGKPARVSALRDLTARKLAEREQERREERVRHAQKLETLGVLAGGIAHDFNNLLAVVLANTELALSTSPREPKLEDALQQIRLASQRARGLTQQLLLYAGRASRTVESIALAELVQSMADLLRVSIPKKHALELELQPALPPIVGDAAQLQQVVMNLVINAADALQDHGGARASDIRLRAFEHALDAETLGRLLGADGLPPGRYVCLEVQDAGVGIAADSLPRIFDPFFTTKQAGRGLGLATVLGIVRAHHGALGVESRPGEGTRMRVYLPVPQPAPLAAREAMGRTESTAPTADAQQGLERSFATIALAEDDTALAAVTAELLRAYGYTVLVTHDGAALVALVLARSAEIDAVLLDLEMPRMNGLEAVRALRQAGCLVPVALMTGHAPSGLAQRAEELELRAVLAKPYEARELLDAVARALGPRSARRSG